MTAVLCAKTLKDKLENFPSTFEFDTTNLTKDRVKNIKRKVEDDRENAPKLETEAIQISNFLSYLYFLLKDSDHAHQCIDESLQKDPNNIIANANKASLLLLTGELSDVDDIVTKLQKMEKEEDFYKRKCYAEADLAYAYSRSGPWYHKRAIDLFKKVLKVFPSEHTWQFGLGLTLIRQTHLFNSQADDRFNSKQSGMTTVHAAELFLTVATKSEDSNLRANAYANLGKAVYNILKRKCTDVPEEIMRLKPEEYFKKALNLCPNEPSVLEICGKFARYRGELDTSEKLLQKSLQIKPTCQAYHHLALTLQRRVEHSGAYGDNRRQTVNKTEEEKGNSHWHGGRSQGSYQGDQARSQQTSGRPYRRRDNLSEERRCSQMIKSPLKVQVYLGNEILKEAIDLLEKTEELTEYGLFIQYDKAIIYRKLGQIEKAVDVFKSIVSKKKNLPNDSLIINIYEQLGLCLLELSETEEISPDMKQKYKKDGQGHLLHAVQIQSEIVANDPQFKEAWNSYPTLKELFSDKRDGKPRQLAALHMLMEEHKDSIPIYEELVQKEENATEPENYINLLECYKREWQYEKCVTLIRSLECTAISSSLPSSLVFDVYIAGAFHAYTSDNTQLAYQHFRRAFKVYSLFEMASEDQNEVDEEEGTKDVLILHSCSNDLKCKHPRNLGTILEDVTGLRYTINSEDVLPNTLLLESMASMIQKIPCIIIMTHEGADSYHQLFVEQAIQRSSEQSGPQVLVVSDDKNSIPDITRTKPFIRLPPPLEGAVDPNGQMPEKYQEWIKEFINLLKPK